MGRWHECSGCRPWWAIWRRGLAIGPNTGLVSDIDEVQTVADLGVALLMFTLGIRFSLRELARVRGLAVFGGLSQIGLMIALGTLLGWALGLATDQALLLGAVVSISSTMVALRLLEDRGELGAPAGRVGVAFALMQDMAVVPLIVMIPVIGGDDANVLPLPGPGGRQGGWPAGWRMDCRHVYRAQSPR